MNEIQYAGLMMGVALFSPFFVMLVILAGQFIVAVRSDMKKGR